MSDGILYEGRMLGSLHAFVYMMGQLPGRPRDFYLRMNDASDFTTLLFLPDEEQFSMEGEIYTAKRFREQILPFVRDVHFERNANNLGAIVEKNVRA